MLQDDGLPIFRYFMENRPDVVNAIPASLWGSSPPCTVSSYGATTLYLLATAVRCRHLLQDLLDKFPAVIGAIPAEVWAQTLTADAGILANRSPLFLLAACDDGIGIIQGLLDKFPNVLGAIPASAWVLAQSAEAGEYANKSPLSLMLNLPMGRNILQSLFAKFPHLALAIRHEVSLSPQLDLVFDIDRLMPAAVGGGAAASADHVMPVSFVDLALSHGLFQGQNVSKDVENDVQPKRFIMH